MKKCSLIVSLVYVKFKWMCQMAIVGLLHERKSSGGDSDVSRRKKATSVYMKERGDYESVS
jgi:hypothetical protein